MSRIAKKGIVLPAKTELSVAGGVVTVKGPKGTLTHAIPETVTVVVQDNVVSVRLAEGAENLALSGTHTAHIKNLIKGVTEGYSKKLIIEGVGYKADVKGKDLVMALGFSHPVKVAIPDGITAVTDKGFVIISGIDKNKVGHFAAYIRDLKKPEPYKGKGFHYDTEVIRRKQGKKSV